MWRKSEWTVIPICTLQHLALPDHSYFVWSSNQRAISPTAASSWAPGEPNNHGGLEHCGEFHEYSNPTARINDRDCEEMRTFMCQTPFKCPLGHFADTPSSCSLCPRGTYQDGARGEGGQYACHPCPAGRYGNLLGESRPGCEGPCAEGFACPPGSTSRSPSFATTEPQPCPVGYTTSEL